MKHTFTRPVRLPLLILSAASITLFAYNDARADSVGDDINGSFSSNIDAAQFLGIAPATEESPIEIVEEIEEEIAEESVNEAVEKVEDRMPALPVTTPAKIAIIIDDMGPDRRNGLSVIKIDAPLTLAFLPYAERLAEMTEAASKRNHELIIHMPMEPENSKLDIGSIGMRDNMSEAQWAQEMDKAFASFEGYAGLNNHMGSLLTQNKAAMDYVMARLVEQGLYFIDSKTIASSVANERARAAGLKTANRDVFLDHENSIEFVRAALAKLEKTAKRKGHAIAIGHPKDVTIQGLQEWIPTLKSKGIELVHASALVRSDNVSVEPSKEMNEELIEEKIEVCPMEEGINIEDIPAQDTEHALKESLTLESPE